MNELRILMDMYNLCVKIDWARTRRIKRADDSFVTVPTGCNMELFSWKLLIGLVLTSVGGQVIN